MGIILALTALGAAGVGIFVALRQRAHNDQPSGSTFSFSDLDLTSLASVFDSAPVARDDKVNKAGFRYPAMWDDHIVKRSREAGIDANLVRAIIATESSFNENARNGNSSALGLGQTTKAAATDLNIPHDQLTNPYTAIDATVEYLRRQIKAAGSEKGGIVSYHVGLGNYQKGKLYDDGEFYYNRVQRYRQDFANA